MTAEGMFYVLAFREAKMCQKLRPFASSCNRIGSVLNFQKIYQRLRKFAKSCESRPKGEKVLENAPKVEKL
jgi:hypothetical protein